ncbi:MAG: glycosyltransferase family 39 protein [Nanoarchaeota archaeon]
MAHVKKELFTGRNILILLFLVFIFLRLFTSQSSILLTSDELKFFEVAKNFPRHTLYNNQLYLLHPPFYPYVIYFFNQVFQDYYKAAVFISIISSIITFFVLYNLFMMITKNFNITYFVLVFFSLSVGFIIASNSPLRESFVFMLISSSIYYYVGGAKFDNAKSIVFATIIGSILALTSDFVVFLLPSLALSYIFFNSKGINIKRLILPNFLRIAVPLAIILLVYGSWTFVKYSQYSGSEYYPNGFEGVPVNTKDLGILQAISNRAFDDFEGTYIAPGILSDIKRLAFNAGYMFNLQPFSIPQGLNFTTMKYLLFPRHIVYMLIIYLPLALLALYSLAVIIKDFIKKKRIHNNVEVYSILMLFVFASQVVQKYTSPRYILLSYVFLFYILSYGFFRLAEKKKINVRKQVVPAISVLLLLIIPFWYANNSNFIFFSKTTVSSQKTGDFINANIPKEANLMVQPGYTVKLIYLTENKIVGLHHDPEQLGRLIGIYNISYIVTGDFFTEVRGLSRDTVRYIEDNPGKFELIAAINEDYSGFYDEQDPHSTDNLYIYKVKT